MLILNLTPCHSLMQSLEKVKNVIQKLKQKGSAARNVEKQIKITPILYVILSYSDDKPGLCVILKNPVEPYLFSSLMLFFYFAMVTTNPELFYSCVS